MRTSTPSSSETIHSSNSPRSPRAAHTRENTACTSPGWNQRSDKQRHESSSSTRSSASSSLTASTWPASPFPPEVTEASIGAIIRLGSRLTDLCDMVSLYTDFETACTDHEMYVYITPHYANEIFRAFTAVRRALCEVISLREYGMGTVVAGAVEKRAAAVVEAMAAWRRDRKEVGSDGNKEGAFVTVGDDKKKEEGRGKEDANEQGGLEELAHVEETAGKIKASVGAIRRVLDETAWNVIGQSEVGLMRHGLIEMIKDTCTSEENDYNAQKNRVDSKN